MSEAVGAWCPKPCSCGLCERQRKRLARREARRAYMAQNPLWLADYEAWQDRVRERKRKKTKRYLRGRPSNPEKAIS
jgi:hypothetical protein